MVWKTTECRGRWCIRGTGRRFWRSERGGGWCRSGESVQGWSRRWGGTRGGGGGDKLLEGCGRSVGRVERGGGGGFGREGRRGWRCGETLGASVEVELMVWFKRYQGARWNMKVVCCSSTYPSELTQTVEDGAKVLVDFGMLFNSLL